MKRLTVSVLALVASALTTPALAEDPAPKPAAAAKPAPAKPTPVAKDAGKPAPKSAEETEPASDPSAASSERPPSRDDSLLPHDHHETAPREAERPLVLRKTADKPLELTSSSATDGLGLKLGVCGLIVAGAVWLLRRRGLLQTPAQTHPMSILGRTAIGVRSELLLVDVDGQKLLLGVTPSSISRLAVLPVHGDTPSLAEGELDPVASPDGEPGFAAALDSAREKLEEFAAGMRRRAPSATPLAERARRPSRHELEDAGEPAGREASPREAARVEASRLEAELREAQRLRARESQIERELRELRASRPEGRSRPDVGEQAQSLLRLRNARGR